MEPRARVSVWPRRRRVPGIVAPDSWGARGAECLPRDVLRHTLPTAVSLCNGPTACHGLCHRHGSGTTEARPPASSVPPAPHGGLGVLSRHLVNSGPDFRSSSSSFFGESTWFSVLPTQPVALQGVTAGEAAQPVALIRSKSTASGRVTRRASSDPACILPHFVSHPPDRSEKAPSEGLRSTREGPRAVYCVSDIHAPNGGYLKLLVGSEAQSSFPNRHNA